jgi:glycosyltransferase involved in cell wall biosynthesis
MRLALAVMWRDPGKWLFEWLPEAHSGELLLAAPETQTRLPAYLRELFFLKKRGYKLSDYDVVFSWELRCALAVALLRKLQRAKNTKWIALGPILKGGVLRCLPFVRWLLADASKIVCFSQFECDEQARLLKLPRERFVFLPLPWTMPESVPESTDQGYILALGQSNRDYATLFRAIAETDLRVIVVAADKTPFGDQTPPKNCTIKFNTNQTETDALIAGARFHVIPLHPAGFSSGQSVLLRAMACQKACVVTQIAGITDYVIDQKTALTVPPGDAEALRSALLTLWDDAVLRERLGTNAARFVKSELGFPRFTERLVTLAGDVLHSRV